MSMLRMDCQRNRVSIDLIVKAAGFREQCIAGLQEGHLAVGDDKCRHTVGVILMLRVKYMVGVLLMRTVAARGWCTGATDCDPHGCNITIFCVMLLTSHFLLLFRY